MTILPALPAAAPRMSIGQRRNVFQPPSTIHQSRERKFMGQIRRVVTGHDKNGKAVVLSDGPVPVTHDNPMRPGQLSHEVWKSSAMTIPIAAVEPEPTTGKRQPHPA